MMRTHIFVLVVLVVISQAVNDDGDKLTVDHELSFASYEKLIDTYMTKWVLNKSKGDYNSAEYEITIGKADEADVKDDLKDLTTEVTTVTDIVYLEKDGKLYVNDTGIDDLGDSQLQKLEENGYVKKDDGITLKFETTEINEVDGILNGQIVKIHRKDYTNLGNLPPPLEILEQREYLRKLVVYEIQVQKVNDAEVIEGKLQYVIDREIEIETHLNKLSGLDDVHQAEVRRIRKDLSDRRNGYEENNFPEIDWDVWEDKGHAWGADAVTEDAAQYWIQFDQIYQIKSGVNSDDLLLSAYDNIDYIQQLNAKAEECAQDIKHLEDQIEMKDEEIKGLRNQLEEASIACAQDKEELRKQLQAANIAKEQLQARLGTLQAQLGAANTAKEQLQAQLGTANTAKEKLQAQLGTANTAKEKLQKQLDEANSDNEKLEEELEKAKEGEITDLEGENTNNTTPTKNDGKNINELAEENTLLTILIVVAGVLLLCVIILSWVCFKKYKKYIIGTTVIYATTAGAAVALGSGSGSDSKTNGVEIGQITDIPVPYGTICCCRKYEVKAKNEKQELVNVDLSDTQLEDKKLKKLKQRLNLQGSTGTGSSPSGAAGTSPGGAIQLITWTD